MADGENVLLGRVNRSTSATQITRSGNDHHGNSVVVAAVGEGPGTTTGVHGEAPRFGVDAVATGHRGIGLWGDSLDRGFGVVGVELSGEGWAGHFIGNVHVSRDLTVRGAVSVILRHSDGSDRRMYALQSPESWFEDFGRAQIVDGRAQVELDNDFAAMVHTDDYHVFLAPEGDTQGLFVSARTPDRFEVREHQGGTSNLAFSYQVVAKRSDIETERLQRIEAPPARADALRPESPEPLE
jgi:hypothetical protein